MIRVAATEFARNFGRYREAAQHEPVAVVAHNRVTGYFVSSREFEEYQRFKATQPVALYAHELSPDDIEAIAKARMDERHAHLDALMD